MRESGSLVGMPWHFKLFFFCAVPALMWMLFICLFFGGHGFDLFLNPRDKQ